MRQVIFILLYTRREEEINDTMLKECSVHYRCNNDTPTCLLKILAGTANWSVSSVKTVYTSDSRHAVSLLAVYLSHRHHHHHHHHQREDYRCASGTRYKAYILPLMVSINLHSNCSGGLRKTISFLQKCRFGRSRSSKVIDFGISPK